MEKVWIWEIESEESFGIGNANNEIRWWFKPACEINANFALEWLLLIMNFQILSIKLDKLEHF